MGVRFQLTAHNWVSVTAYFTDTEAAIHCEQVDSPSLQTTTPLTLQTVVLTLAGKKTASWVASLAHWAQ